MNEEATEAGGGPDINEISFSSTSTAALDKSDIAEERIQEEDDEENEYRVTFAFEGKLDEAIAILKQQDIFAVQLKG